MATIGIGMIGTGFMAKAHSYGYKNLPFYAEDGTQARLVAVASRSEERGEAFAERFGYEKVYSDYHDMLADEEVQAVSICTPNVLHYEQAKAAILAGKHVYIEKPMTVTLEQAEELARLAEEKGVVGQVVFNSRFMPNTMRAKQLVAEGFLGNIISIRGTILHSGLVDTARKISWRLDPELTGQGVLFDLGSHLLDMTMHLCGSIDSVLCETMTLHKTRQNDKGESVEIKTDDAAWMMVKLPNGAVGTLEASKLSTAAEGDFRLEIMGEKGAIFLDMMDPHHLEVFDNTVPDGDLGGMRGRTRINVGLRYPAPASRFPQAATTAHGMRGHAQSVYSFLTAVATGSKACPDLAQGAAVQRAMEAAYRSAETQQWMKI